MGVMLNADAYDPPPSRDRLPTLPEDLSEYARIHTGPPPPWSEDDGALMDESASAFDDISIALLVDLWQCDVPQIISFDLATLDEREIELLMLVDGQMTVGMLLEASELPIDEVLGSVCNLSARGVIALDRSARIRPTI